jgi:hypothetical protein
MLLTLPVYALSVRIGQLSLFQIRLQRRIAARRFNMN